MDWIANLEKLEILKFDMSRFNEEEIDIKDFTEKMFGKLTNLKSLELVDCSLMYEPEFLANIHEIIQSLETLIMTSESDFSHPMDIDYLVEVLDSIGNVRNLYIKDCVDPFYLLNNKEFRRTLPTNFDKDQIKSIFENALDTINKKFSIDSTNFKIVDNEYGWSIEKKNGQAPTMTQLCYKCTAKDEQGKTCTEFFAEKTKWEEHVEHDLKYGYGHSFPHCYL